LIALPDSAFVSAKDAVTARETLVKQYVTAFRKIEIANHDAAREGLKELAATVSASIVSDKQPALRTIVDGQLAKLS
jgi:hypothetical protein